MKSFACDPICPSSHVQPKTESTEPPRLGRPGRLGGTAPTFKIPSALCLGTVVRLISPSAGKRNFRVAGKQALGTTSGSWVRSCDPVSVRRADRITPLSTLQTQNHPANIALSTCQPSNNPPGEKYVSSNTLSFDRGVVTSCNGSVTLL